MHISSVTMIDLLQLTMNVQQQRARTASYNIAMAHQPDKPVIKLNHTQFLSQIQEALLHSAQPTHVIDQYRQQQPESLMVTTHKQVALDTWVLENLQASGRYQQIADGLSRQLGLIQLSIRGSRS